MTARNKEEETGIITNRGNSASTRPFTAFYSSAQNKTYDKFRVKPD
jgi:hypothetical protein